MDVGRDNGIETRVDEKFDIDVPILFENLKPKYKMPRSFSSFPVRRKAFGG